LKSTFPNINLNDSSEIFVCTRSLTTASYDPHTDLISPSSSFSVIIGTKNTVKVKMLPKIML